MISCSIKTGDREGLGMKLIFLRLQFMISHCGEGLGTRLRLLHLQFMISCGIKTGGREGLGTRLDHFRLRFMSSCSTKTGGGGRPGNEVRTSLSPVYDLPLWGRPGNKARPSLSPVYDLLRYKSLRQGKAWEQGSPIQHSIYYYRF